MLKSFLRSAPVQSALGRLIAAYIRWVADTTRWTVVNAEAMEPLWRSGRGVVGCVWHGRVLMTVAAWPKHAQPAKILISRSRDGSVIAEAAERLGVPPIRGSARNPKKDKVKGGITAFREMMSHVEDGGVICIAADGPRGPRMRAGAGPVKLAALTGAPLVALGWSTRRRIVFDSWDRFVLPLPFGPGVIVWGGPFDAPPKDADAVGLDAARIALEGALIEITQEADRRAGVAVIEPAAPAPDTADPETNAPGAAPDVAFEASR